VAKISEKAAERNAKYKINTSTWSGDAKNIAKKTNDEYGDVKSVAQRKANQSM